MRVVDVEDGVLSVSFEDEADCEREAEFAPASLALSLCLRLCIGGSVDESLELLELFCSLVPDEKDSCWNRD